MRKNLFKIVFFIITDTCSALSSTTCAPCNCDIQGSTTPFCDSSGKCPCKQNFYGTKCSNRDCKLSDWTQWAGHCPCGQDTIKRNRTRSVLTSLLGKGKPCATTRIEESRCALVPCDCDVMNPGYYGVRCDKRDCKLGEWSSWTDTCYCPRETCSITINDLITSTPSTKCAAFTTPTKQRSRGVSVHKAGSGIECNGTRSDSSDCAFRCQRFCRLNSCYYDRAL